jgi:hypothetical protein
MVGISDNPKNCRNSAVVILDSLGTGTPIAGTPRTWAKDSELIGINFC